MLAAVKKLIESLVDIQHNPPALVALIAIAAMGVAAFSLYVVLQLGHK